MAAEEAGEPGQVAVAEPFVVREAEDSETSEGLEQIPREGRQVVVVQRPAIRGGTRKRVLQVSGSR